MSASQWHMNRLGLVDFWYYDNDEFYFENGHMLLRGSNGTGKSVTMQSFIPLLLDGNKSSERLDTFGSRSRKLESYLIDENSDRDERIGYLYLEFKREEGDIYTTIGMGLHARKNKPLQSWYFVIEDNRRVNIDFSLMNGRLTLTKKQLENILGKQVISKQKTYMAKVNDVLFGFPTLDDYKDALSLLLQLRSPKLSNSLSTDIIKETLSNSLLPLSDDDLRPMSEAINNMDNLHDELESLQNSLEAAKKIEKAYDSYNKAILIDKYQKFREQDKKLKSINKSISENEKSLKKMEDDIFALNEAQGACQMDIEVLRKERNNLIDLHMERLHDELLSLNQRVINLKKEIDIKQKQYETKFDSIIDLNNDIEDYHNKLDDYKKQVSMSLSVLDDIYDSFPYSEHPVLKEAMKNKRRYDFEWSKRALKEENNKVHQALTAYQSYENTISLCDSTNDEIARFNNDLLENDEQLTKAQRQYRESINEYQEYFYKYSQDNEVLKLTAQELNELTDLLVDYENTQDYQALKSIVYQRYQIINDDYCHNRNKLKIEATKLNDNYNQVLDDYHQLLSKEEVEPERDESTLSMRAYLKSEGIPFKPLYQLLDFEDNIEEEMKNRIEEILSRMAILDALVVEDKYQEKLLSLNHHDYFLWTRYSIDDLETVYLTSDFNALKLNNVLDCLGIENSEAFFIDETSFKSGLLEGNVDTSISASYIGSERRKQLRQNKLDELKSNLTKLDKMIEGNDQKINKIDNELSLLKKELNDLRDDKGLRLCFDKIIRLQKDNDYIVDKIDYLEEQLDSQKAKAKAIYNDFNKQCYDMIVEASKEALNYREQCISQYEMNLDELKDEVVSYDHYQQLLDLKQEKHDELQSDIDEISAEIAFDKQEKGTCEKEAAMINRQLDEQGYHDKQARLEEIETELNQKQQNLQDNIKQLSRLETKQETTQLLLEDLANQQASQQALQHDYYEVLVQEVHYGFFVEDDEDMLKNVRALYKEVKTNHPLSDYLTSLQGIFFEQVSLLSQYHLSYEVDELCCNCNEVSGHFLIHASYLGNKISFKELVNVLTNSIENQQLLIMDEDRHLFEDILVNTIGKKIRGRIQSSKRWVKKMERYMKDMNISSGLKLSLKWQSKKADSDDELDTAQLVELLEKDYRVLKESDRQKISQHFRTKINKARQLSLDDNTSKSFHQLINEVMDYRQWFEFTLYVSKPNEKRKELTNRLFNSYSGGEKAIIMYAPLFSAVAAKFESAREDAPHIIALDEAFAGVDENNIDSMFELIEKFNFDYIMTSQILWGDYTTCKSLAIYELIRPKDAPYITSIAYKWNGHARKVKT